jgi:hypothetical protein
MLVIPPHLPLEKGGKFPLYEEGMKGCVPLFSKEGSGEITDNHSPVNDDQLQTNREIVF